MASFFTFERAIAGPELAALQRNITALLARAPAAPGSALDRAGRPQ
jgi:hypothetical protein